MLTILFPSDPLRSNHVDSAFAAERAACHDLGIEVGFVDIDRMSFRWEADQAATSSSSTVVYRGWILTNHQYGRLYEALWSLGHRMVNTPDEYRFCQELPEWYDALAGVTPKSMWSTNAGLSFEDQLDGKTPDLRVIAAEVQEQLGPGPYIIKDFVKSRKHEWHEACYIPGPEAIEKVTRRFIELQGEDLAGGLVFRQYVPFRQVGEHPKSGMPLCNEVRTLSLGSRTISKFPYWGADEGGSAITMPHGIVTFRSTDPKDGEKCPTCKGTGERRRQVGRRVYPVPCERCGGKGQASPSFQVDRLIKSNFYSMDIAQLDADVSGWSIVELGDGQVTGLPEHADLKEFYGALAYRFGG